MTAASTSPACRRWSPTSSTPVTTASSSAAPQASPPRRPTRSRTRSCGPPSRWPGTAAEWWPASARTTPRIPCTSRAGRGDRRARPPRRHALLQQADAARPRRHFTAVADATPLPVMLYDIPARAGIPIATETLLRLAEHPRIAAVKDAKGDLWSATKVLDQTDLLWFSGDDVATLAHLTQGATGYVGVTTHVAGAEYAAMLAAVDVGDLATAVGLHRRLIPVVDAIMNTSQGADHGQGRAQGARRHRLGRPSGYRWSSRLRSTWRSCAHWRRSRRPSEDLDHPLRDHRPARPRRPTTPRRERLADRRPRRAR